MKQTLDKTKDYFSMAEVAELLGVTKQTVRNYIVADKIKTLKITGVIRIHRSELLKLGIKLGE